MTNAKTNTGAAKPIGKIKPVKKAVPAPKAKAKPKPKPAPKPAPQPARPKVGWSATKPMVLGVIALIILVGGFGGWSAFTNISGAIIASGQIEVDRNRQVVQHPDGGVVAEILVDEGDRVERGQPLIRIDPTLLDSRLVTAESQLFEILARKARLVAERDEANGIVFPEMLMDMRAEAQMVDELIEGQKRLFEARRLTVTQSVDQLRGRREQIAKQIDGIVSQQTALEAQLSLIEEELTAQTSLLDRGLTQASQVLSLRREEARLRGSVGELIANAAEAAERISEIDIQILGLTSQRREEAITQLRDLQFREVEYIETVATLREQLSRMVITAPVAGLVYNMVVFAERSVIRPADPVLYIIPQDRPLVIMTQVEPIHVDQVQVGQDVMLRFSTFDQRTTPELQGEVLKISADAFSDESSQASFYRAEIGVRPGELDRLPENVNLIPGMPVEAFLRTEDRTPLAYLVKPLMDYFTKAFRES